MTDGPAIQRPLVTITRSAAIIPSLGRRRDVASPLRIWSVRQMGSKEAVTSETGRIRLGPKTVIDIPDHRSRLDS